MLFRKREEAPGEAPVGGGGGEEVLDDAKVKYGGYTLIPRVKQLVNGNWIARITLEEERDDGSRQYDFAGPMSEFASKEEATRGGIEHAKTRLTG